MAYEQRARVRLENDPELQDYTHVMVIQAVNDVILAVNDSDPYRSPCDGSQTMLFVEIYCHSVNED